MARKTKQSPATSADVSPTLPLPAAVKDAVSPPAPAPAPAPDSAYVNKVRKAGENAAKGDILVNKNLSEFRAIFAAPGILHAAYEAAAAVWRGGYCKQMNCDNATAVTAFNRFRKAADVPIPVSKNAGAVDKAAKRAAEVDRWKGKTPQDIAAARVAALQEAAALINKGDGKAASAKIAEAKEADRAAARANKAAEKTAADHLKTVRARVIKRVESAGLEMLARIEALFAAPPVTGSVGAELQKIA